MRLSLLFLFICSSVIIFAKGSRFKVHFCKGDVRVERDGVAQPASVKQPLSNRDRFILKKGARLGVVDQSNNRIYYVEEAGCYTLRHLIWKAKAKSNYITRLMLKKVASSSKDNTAISILGAASHMFFEGPTSKFSTTEKIYSLIYKKIKEGELYSDSIILQCKKNKQDGFFRITNRTNHVLYINIVIIPMDEYRPSLVFDIDKISPQTFIMPFKSINFPQYPIELGSSGVQYVLFATNEEYNPLELNRLLYDFKVFETDEDINCIFLYGFKP